MSLTVASALVKLAAAPEPLTGPELLLALLALTGLIEDGIIGVLICMGQSLPVYKNNWNGILANASAVGRRSLPRKGVVFEALLGFWMRQCSE